MRPRVVAAIWLAVLVVSLATALWLLVPWSRMPVVGEATLHLYFTDAEIARADRFAGEIRPPSYLSLLVSLVLVALLTLTRRGLAFVGRFRRGPRWLQVPILVAVVMLAAWLVTLPLDIWREVVLREWDLSTQTWGGWLLDGIKGLAITWALTSTGLVVLVWLARRMPRWWFLPASLAVIVLTFVMSFAYPLVVEPVFNRFESMPQGELRTSLLRLAERDGVPVDDVLIADASRRTTRLNAYVSGFGATRRIVVYDTLLDQAPEDEVEVIVAHELGHADDNDVVAGTTLAALAGAIGIVLVWWVLDSRWARSRGAGAGEPLSAVVVLGLAVLTGFALSPVTNGVSRIVELRADEHALALSGRPDTVIEMQQRLAITNIADLTPPRWASLWFASHPSVLERIELARESESS
jgi:STE24 endopeptidase